MIPIFQKPEIHEKIWGKEIWIANSPQYCGKILDFKAGFYSSLHFHKVKTETWYILNGIFFLEYYNENQILTKKQLYPNDVIHLNPGTLHKIIAVEDGKILEVSTQHFEEDSIRLENSGKIESFWEKKFFFLKLKPHLNLNKPNNSNSNLD